MEELKPCPFCGAIPKVNHLDYPFIEIWFVKCENCSAEINNPRSTEQEALKDWNRRFGEKQGVNQ